MMKITIGTFNLNNLFSRYNFNGEIEAIKKSDTSVSSDLEYVFGPNSVFKIRTYLGKLVKEKDKTDTDRIAERIKAINVDILAIQEAEDIDTLKQFNKDCLGGMYKYVILIEGNDPRLIDVGVLSKLPIGAVTSWQQAINPADPDNTVFGRDMLEVEILNPSRSQKLLTLFNNHLKSHFVEYGKDPVIGEQENSLRRTRQSETIAEIVKSRTQPNDSFVVLGDMNDPPDSVCLKPFTADTKLKLANALIDPTETRPAKPDNPPPASKAWTHRYKTSGKPAQYELYDQIWLSQALAPKKTCAWIDRRKRHSGGGSDHDPAWIEADI